jgi:hypothetical protein
VGGAAAQGQFGEDLGHDDAAGQIARGMAAHPVRQHGKAEFRALRTGHGHGVFLALAAALRLRRGDVVMGLETFSRHRAVLLRIGAPGETGAAERHETQGRLADADAVAVISSSVDRTGMPLRRTMLDLLPWPRKKRFCSAS